MGLSVTNKPMRLSTILPRLMAAVALLMTACGDGADVQGQGPASAPPTVASVEDQPPAAWVETPSGSSWMQFGSYCWGSACVDMMPATQRDDIPMVSVEQGQEVTFHLGFTPGSLRLSFLPDGESVGLPAEQEASWHVSRGGLLSLFADVPDGGDASYTVHLAVEGNVGTVGDGQVKSSH